MDYLEPDVEFEIDTTSDASTVSSVIKNTFNHLENNSYKAVVFLGDTNNPRLKQYQIHL